MSKRPFSRVKSIAGLMTYFLHRIFLNVVTTLHLQINLHKFSFYEIVFEKENLIPCLHFSIKKRAKTYGKSPSFKSP